VFVNRPLRPPRPLTSPPPADDEYFDRASSLVGLDKIPSNKLPDADSFFGSSSIFG